MFRKYTAFVFFYWIIIAPFTLLHAQIDISGLDLNANVADWFDQNIGLDHTKLLSGTYQQIFRSSRTSFQFFESNYWGIGGITYFGKRYENIHLFYDIEADEVLLRHPTKISFYSQPIKLQQQHISAFELFGHSFKYYAKQQNPLVVAGFYDELFMGKEIQLIVRRSKEKLVSREELGMGYEIYDKYFICYDGNYYQLKRSSSLLKILMPYKKELKKYIRQNQLIIAAGQDKDLVHLLSFFEEMVKDS